MPGSEPAADGRPASKGEPLLEVRGLVAARLVLERCAPQQLDDAIDLEAARDVGPRADQPVDVLDQADPVGTEAISDVRNTKQPTAEQLANADVLLTAAYASLGEDLLVGSVRADPSLRSG